MSHNPYTVIFPGGTQLYGVSNGACLLRPLFDTPEQAMAEPRHALYCAAEPDKARLTQVAVTVAPGSPWESTNRASFDCRWLTGPANSDEHAAEEPIDFGPYGAADLPLVSLHMPTEPTTVLTECPRCGAADTLSASSWITDGVFKTSEVDSYGVTCHACKRDYMLKIHLIDPQDKEKNNDY